MRKNGFTLKQAIHEVLEADVPIADDHKCVGKRIRAYLKEHQE
jgi:hypothetical protein